MKIIITTIALFLIAFYPTSHVASEKSEYSEITEMDECVYLKAKPPWYYQKFNPATSTPQ